MITDTCIDEEYLNLKCSDLIVRISGLLAYYQLQLLEPYDVRFRNYKLLYNIGCPDDLYAIYEVFSEMEQCLLNDIYTIYDLWSQDNSQAIW